MVFIYHRLKKPSVFDFEHIPLRIRNFIFYLKRRFFPNIDIQNLKQAEYPLVNTSSIPGPKGKGALNTLALYSYDFKNKRIFVNPEQSFKNFVVDADDNIILDLNIQGTPLGYNHPNLIKLSCTPENEKFVSNSNVNSIHTITTDTLAYLNELKSYIQIGDLNTFFPTNNINDSLYNMILINDKFNKNNKKTVVANLADSINSERKDNESEEDYLYRLAEEVNQTILKNKDFLLGVILEPFSETKFGHLYLNSNFANQIRYTCAQSNIAFIVDETNSCLNSGHVFGLNSWNLEKEPDYVILRDNSNINPGILTTLANAELANFLQSINLHTKSLSNSLEILKYVKEENLLSSVITSGDYIRSKLSQDTYKNKIYNVRGVGTYTSFDLINKQARDSLNESILNKGVSLYANGQKSITSRSSLIVETKHYDALIDAVNNSKI